METFWQDIRYGVRIWDCRLKLVERLMFDSEFLLNIGLWDSGTLNHYELLLTDRYVQ
jgi:hypothetical protein